LGYVKKTNKICLLLRGGFQNRIRC
jgi:hypothetical protein